MTIAGAAEIRRRFDEAPMSRVQVTAVAITVILSALDGYDVLSVTFAAPALTLAWGIGKAALGIVLSSGLVGMALGSFLLAPLADLVGRRRLILLSMVLMGLGSLLCGFAHSLPQLALWRVVTGLGIGTCVAVINPIAAEFANKRRRALASTLMALGYPVGGLIGGLLSAVLLKLWGWPAVFFAGFGFSLLLLPTIAMLLPESLAFLLNDPRPGGLARLNGLLARCGQPAVATLPEPEAASARSYAAIFAPGQIATTIRLMIVNLLAAAMVYFVLSWLPQMAADAGLAPSRASLVAATANLVGLLGGMLVGTQAPRFGLKRLTVTMLIGLGFATAAFGATPAVFGLMVLASGICGFFLFGAVSGLYATLAISFKDAARASGSGFVIGVGRVSSAGAPALAGWLFASGFGRAEVSLAFGACAVIAGLVLATGGKPTIET